MKLEKYISRLLSENETVIVPGFGAFTTKDKPAQFDETSENILPPSKEITFNPEIRNNDGLLVGYIAQQENISHFDALHIIENEREDILYRLDKGEKVELKKVGVFWYSESHELQFEALLRNDLSPESFGLGATSLTGPEFVAEEKPAEKEIVPTKNEQEEPVQQEPEPDFEPVEEIDPELKRETQEKRKKRSWFWLLLILIPLVGAGIYIAMNQENSSTEVREPLEIEQNMMPETTVPEETVAIDSLQNDSVEKAEDDSVQAAEITEPGEPKFYLIAGSFKEQENAEEYMLELKNDNYDPFYLGKKGNFHLIGISTYNSEHAAIVAQDSFLAEHPDSGAWVYEE